MSNNNENKNELGEQLAILEQLIDDIDQLASTARDCQEVSNVRKALDLAWYIAEADLREADPRGTGSCGHTGTKRPQGDYCANCAHFEQLRAKGEHLRRIL